MSGEIERGKCSICGKDTQLLRSYFHYDIKCECHSPKHYEIVWHCKECSLKVKPPTFIKVTLKQDPIY